VSKLNLIKGLVAVFFAGVMSVATASTEAADAALVERIQPVGQVCIEGNDCGGSAAVASGPRSGEDVYKTFCTACHGTGAMGSPKSHDKGAWGSRLAKGMNKTLANAINGLNMMPAKGTCGDCSDDELQGAIEFMSK
jgi:cytochrome c5